MPEMPVSDEAALCRLGVISDRLRDLVNEVRALREDLRQERERRDRAPPRRRIKAA